MIYNQFLYFYFLVSPSSSRRHNSLDEILALTTSNVALNGRQRSFSDSGGNFTFILRFKCNIYKILWLNRRRT